MGLSGWLGCGACGCHWGVLQISCMRYCDSCVLDGEDIRVDG